jgi:DNA-binding GntR family transcriptional regulator
MRQLERPQSLTAMAVEHLREAIVSGDLELGEQLSEAELARRLGISKTPVREALQQLRAEGLVRVVPQTGTFVFTMSALEVRQLCELRLTLERAALGFALERDRAGLVSALGKVVAGMRKALRTGDVRRYLAFDTAYHATFFAHCGNPMMRDAHDRLVGRIAALRTHLAQKPSHTERSMDEHVRMLEAARTGDGPTLFTLLDQHVERTRETYAANIGDIAQADRAERVRLGQTA